MCHVNRGIRSFYNLDSKAYKEGALSEKVKGPVASMVLRCGDRITCHIIVCKKAGVEEKELMEALAIALVVDT